MAAERHDVVIVGAGAAGLSCALECVDVRLDTVVYEAGVRVGGQLIEIPHLVRNVLGWRYDAGEDVLRAIERSTAILGDCVRRAARVTAVDLPALAVEVGTERIDARAVVLAMGARQQELPGAPDGAFGGDVSYLIEAQPGHFDGRDVVVIGGGDSATLDALELAAAGSIVTLAHRASTLSARADIVARVWAEPRVHDLPGWELDSLRGGDRLEEVVLRDADGEQRCLPAGGLVVKIARVPNTELVRGQVELDGRGSIVVDTALRTSLAGVFAAGDVTADSHPRIATAIGQGVLAAHSVLRHLQARP